MQKIVENVFTKCPESIPELPQKITEKDGAYLQQTIKKNMGKKVQVNILRLVAAECFQSLGKPGFLKFLLDVNFPQIEHLNFAPEARLRICEGITQADEVIRAHTVEVHLRSFEKEKHLLNEQHGRIQVIRGGLSLLQSNFQKASMEYLNASKEEAFMNNEQKRKQLINQSIALAFISSKSPELHKIVCSLFINDLAKRSELYPIVNRLYSKDMINPSQLAILRKLLPHRMEEKDTDGVSILSRAIFSHNMLAIISNFSTISLESAHEMIGLSVDELLLMIEKTYREGEIEVDLMNGYLHIHSQEPSTQIKKWFDSIDQVLGQQS